MPQTFRLRLGDGTILKVDHGGLSAWETDPTAAVGTRDPNKWFPLKEFLIQERAAAFRRAREGDSGESPPADTPLVSARADGLPLVPPPEPPLPAPPEKVSSLELPPLAEGPALAEASVAGELFVPEAPRSRVVEEPPRGSTLPEPAESVPPAPTADEIDLEPLAVASMGPSQVAPSVAPIEQLPVIPLKSLEDVAPTAAPDGSEPAASTGAPDVGVLPLADEPSVEPAGPSRRTGISDEASVPDEPVRLPGLVTAVLQWSTVLGVILSRGLAPINRLEQGLPLFGIDDPSAPLESYSSPASAVCLPSLSVDFDGARSRVSAALRDLSDRTREGVGAVGSRVRGLVTRPARPETSPLDHSEEPTALGPPQAPSPPAVAPAALTPAAVAPSLLAPPATALSAPAPSPPSARRAPSVATDLPALRLAPLPEPRVVGDVYAGDEGGGVASPVRLWTRRLFLTAAVLAGGVLAARHWDAWSPSAGKMGWAFFDEIDGQVRWLHLARERQALIDQASDQLPHLARDTVGLILSGTRTYVPEPPVVFETAWGAAERGAPTLTASETEELEALRQELLDALPPLDRERLRAFGQAHARGAVFPFDAQRGLLAYARGVRALPPEHKERLQTLLGKAIAAGLDS